MSKTEIDLTAAKEFIWKTQGDDWTTNENHICFHNSPNKVAKLMEEYATQKLEAALPVILDSLWVKFSDRIPPSDKGVFIKESISNDSLMYVGSVSNDGKNVWLDDTNYPLKNVMNFLWLDESLASDEKLKTKIGLK